MGLSVLSIPTTTQLSTLDAVKAELGIADTSSDPVLMAMLRRASSAITRECGRPSFGVSQYQETLKGSGSQLLALACVPLLNVTQVLQDSEVVNPSDPDQGYSIEDAEAGVLYRACGWGQSVALLSWGWQAYASQYILPGGTATLRYTVTYTAGYQLYDAPANPPYDPTSGVTLDTHIPPTVPNVPPVLNVPSKLAQAPPLPGALEQATLIAVKAWWFSRGRDTTLTRMTTGPMTEVYGGAATSEPALPAAALSLLRDYRRIA